jgi:hypothetical protein
MKRCRSRFELACSRKTITYGERREWAVTYFSGLIAPVRLPGYRFPGLSRPPPVISTFATPKAIAGEARTLESEIGDCI